MDGAYYQVKYDLLFKTVLIVSTSSCLLTAKKSSYDVSMFYKTNYTTETALHVGC